MPSVNVELIKKLRLSNKLTLQDMAERLGFKTLWGYRHCESGNVDFKPEHIKIIADMFNVEIDSLFLSKELRKTQYVASV